jgi:predicted ATPase
VPVLVRAAESTVAGEYRHGTALVDVSSLDDAAPVVTAVAHALRLPAAAGHSQADLARALSVQDALLVIDSAERVPRLGALIAGLHGEAPGLTVVVTSRIPLGVPGESRFPVPPLAVPAGGATADLGDNPSVRLFIDRAQAVAPEFKLTDTNAGAVTALCVRLGGLPLALELAAARVQLLPVTDLPKWLDRGLDVLSTTSPRLPERQQSLRATLDWTCGLLDPATRRLLAALGVFRGGFSVEAVKQTCAPGQAVLDRLEELLETGLLVRALEPDGRLTMLDTVADYTSELLTALPSQAELRDRHLAYYLGLAERVRQELSTGRQADALAALERDHDNLREALDWCATKTDGSGLRLAVTLASFWRLHGHLGEGRRQLTRALASCGAAEELRGRALYALAVLAFYQGDLADAQHHARQSLALHRANESRLDIADSLNILGNVARERGEHAVAVGHYEASLAIFRDARDHSGVAAALSNLGTTAYFQRDFARAAALHTESLSMRAKLDDSPDLAKCLYGLANVSRESGELDNAVEYGLQSLALREQLGDRHGSAVTLTALASTYRARGEPGRAADQAAVQDQLGQSAYTCAHTLGRAGTSTDAG